MNLRLPIAFFLLIIPYCGAAIRSIDLGTYTQSRCETPDSLTPFGVGAHDPSAATTHFFDALVVIVLAALPLPPLVVAHSHR
jgi:hypothetical protein